MKTAARALFERRHFVHNRKIVAIVEMVLGCHHERALLIAVVVRVGRTRHCRRPHLLGAKDVHIAS